MDMTSLSLQAFRILFLLGVPVLIGVVAGGLISGAFQGATAIRDSSIGYACRLAGVIIALYLVLPATVDTLLSFTRAAVGP